MNPFSIHPAALLAAIVACLALGFGGGWEVQGWRLNAELAARDADHARQMKAVSDTAEAAARTVAQQQADWQTKLAEQDARHQQEMNDAKRKEQDLRAALDSGTQRLRVRAQCPAAGSRDVPDAAPAAGVVNAATVELAPESRQDYLDLRAGIEHDQQVIRGLQEYVRTITGAMP